MPYDENVASRVRSVLKRRKNLTERRMFGGLAFLLNGNMCCGVIGDHIMLRLGEQGAAEALERPYTRTMDFTGKPMKSMIYVDPPGFSKDEVLKEWVDRAVTFAKTLPPKQ